MNSDYVGFFLNSNSNVLNLQTIEIYHPSYSKTYYIVRNNVNGLELTLENGISQFFEYYPLKIEKTEQLGDLDQGVSIQFGDLGEILPKEVDLVTKLNGFGIKPTVKYREYRSDDTSAPMLGPLLLQITSHSHNKDGVTFEAHAPFLNLNRTGRSYSLTGKFRTLRGFL